MTRTEAAARRARAKAAKKTHYFGGPCGVHPEHINAQGETLRYSNNGGCVECAQARARKNYADNPQYYRDWHRLNTGKQGDLCGVYVIRQLNRWKFGVICGKVSNHMKRYSYRASAFATLQEAEDFIPCSSKAEAHKLETELHTIFNHRRVPVIEDESGGEWFEWEPLYEYVMRTHRESIDRTI